MNKMHIPLFLAVILLTIGSVSQTTSFAENNLKNVAVKTEEPKKPERDPMWPVSMALFEPVRQKQVQIKQKHAPYRVQGKGKSAKGSYVVIGGNVLREGETKGEITVVKIGDTKVDILVNGIPESLPIE